MAIGIDSDGYGTHSGRIGGATMLWEGGASDAEIMQLGRWKSDCWKIYCHQVKSKCLKLSALVGNSELTYESLVGNGLDLTVEIEERVAGSNEDPNDGRISLVGSERWSASKSRRLR